MFNRLANMLSMVQRQSYTAGVFLEVCKLNINWGVSLINPVGSSE